MRRHIIWDIISLCIFPSSAAGEKGQVRLDKKEAELGQRQRVGGREELRRRSTETIRK